MPTTQPNRPGAVSAQFQRLHHERRSGRAAPPLLIKDARASVGPAIIAAGGFDLITGTLAAIKAGQLEFTIDQKPYLQGFLPTLYLYLFNLSGGLVAPPDTDTGLTFVTKATVDGYLVPSRFEGSTEAQQVIPRSGPIINPVAT